MLVGAPPSHLVTGLALAGWSFVFLGPRLEAEPGFQELVVQLSPGWQSSETTYS